MKAHPIVVATFSLLLGYCTAGGTNVAMQSNMGVTNIVRLVATQEACRVFSTAQNRKVDRMRLCKAARKSLFGAPATNAVSTTIGVVGGLRVESVNYIESNKVEAVFSAER